MNSGKWLEKKGAILVFVLGVIGTLYLIIENLRIVFEFKNSIVGTLTDVVGGNSTKYALQYLGSSIMNGQLSTAFSLGVIGIALIAASLLYVYGDADVEFNENIVIEGTVKTMETSDKSKVVAALLCFFLGWLGMHRIYLGRVGSGIALIILNIIGYLTTAILIGFVILAITGIWEIIDFFRIILGGLKDKDGRPLK